MSGRVFVAGTFDTLLKEPVSIASTLEAPNTFPCLPAGRFFPDLIFYQRESRLHITFLSGGGEV